MAHNIQLDAIEPHQENLEQSLRLFRNGMLSKLTLYVKQQAVVPSWLQALQNDQWRQVSMTPPLVYLLTRKPLVLDFDEVGAAMEKKPYPQLFTNINAEMRDYYMTKCNEEHGTITIEPWKKPHNDIADKISQALMALAIWWPDGHSLATLLIKEIYLVDSPHLLSATMPRFHGAILLSPKSDWGVAHFIEALVHEASHLELNVRRMVEPFLLNPSETAYSALRSELRPLLGILHAAFVLCRTTESLLRTSSEPSLHHECRLLYQQFVPILHDTLASLCASARFTEVGAQLYANMNEKARRMSL